jgi:lipopolysaccharide transport system ATP-binding protein
MPPAIRVENLGKKYLVAQGNPCSGYRTLRESLVAAAAAPFRRLRGGFSRPGPSQDFWALKDVSFDVQPGEVVGIIGRNGAGKSTILKILSRITKPTSGRVLLRGRVGSLLEVGTGFHPELTGRENIFLNAAILGMSRSETRKKFDDIVQFAEVEQFLDTPVKRYSSGMYVRLAFAVAAYLEPEILIVDEVLAVGDLGFQRKCMGRMREFGKQGCTVLFVSHNMPAIESLCSRAVLLEDGGCVSAGDVEQVIRDYRQRIMERDLERKAPSHGRDECRRRWKIFRSVELMDQDNRPTNYLPLGGRMRLRIVLQSSEKIECPQIGIAFENNLGHRMLTVHTPVSHSAVPAIRGHCEVHCNIESFPLAPGDYWIKLGISHGGAQIDMVDQALFFSVLDGDAYGDGRGFSAGACIARSTWSIN